jgi:hypothetical protein
LVFAAWGELQARAGGEIDDGAGYEDLAGVGEGRDALGVCTAIPTTPVGRASISPVWSPARQVMPCCLAASSISAAHRTARAEPSNVARVPSPVDLTIRPRWLATRRSIVWSC